MSDVLNSKLYFVGSNVICTFAMWLVDELPWKEYTLQQSPRTLLGKEGSLIKLQSY